MSTKIYNAYKFNGSMESLLAHLAAYKEKWIHHQISRICSLEKIPKYKELLELIRTQSTQWTSSYKDEFDVRGSVVVFFRKKQIYLIKFLNNPHPEFLDDRFEDFHYQNQTDPWYEYDEALTPLQKISAARNWKFREKVWDEIFSTSSVPASSGLTYDFCNHLDYMIIATDVAKLLKDKN